MCADLIKRIKICIDFDSTLSTKKIQKLYQDLVDMDMFDIFVITTRYDELHYHNYVSPEYDNNSDLWAIIDRLHIPHRNVFFTNYNWKIQYLNKTKVNLLIDDNEDELNMLREHFSTLKIHGISANGNNILNKIKRLFNLND